MRRKAVSVVLVFLFSYVGVLTIPIGFALVSYERAINDTEARSLAALTRLLANHGRLLDSRIEEVRDTIDRILINAEVRNLFRDPVNVVLRYRATRSLREFVVSSRLVNDVMVFFIEHDVLLSSGFSVTNPGRFYGTLFWSDHDSYTTFSADLSQRVFAKEHGIPLFLETTGTALRMDTWTQTVSEAESLSPAVVMVLVDHREVQGAIGALVEPSGLSWLTDARGALLATVRSADNAGGADRYTVVPEPPFSPVEGADHSGYRIEGDSALAYTRLLGSGWQLFVRIPLDDRVRGVSSLRAIFSITTALAIVFGGVASLALATRFGRPLAETFNALEGRTPALPLLGVRSLGQAVQGVVHENQLNTAYISKNLPVIRGNVIYRVLTGSYQSLDALHADEANASLQVYSPSAVYMATEMRIDASLTVKGTGLFHEMDQTNALVREYLHSLVPADTDRAHTDCAVFVREMEQQRSALLFVGPAEAIDDFRKRTIDSLLELLKESRGPMTAFGSGRPVSNVLSVYRSLEDARHALDHAGKIGYPQVIEFHDAPVSETHWRYSLETEGRLIAALKTNDSGKVFELIEQVYSDNVAGAGGLRVRNLAAALRGTVLRLLNDPDYQDVLTTPELIADIDRAEQSQNLDQLRDWSITFFGELLAHIAEARHRHQDQAAQAVISYVDQRVFDPTFSFRAFADHFHMAEAAMSRQFKDLSGVTFSEYVEKTRLNHAHQLLATSSLSVAEVATAVCYSSPQAFRRAFKRRFHVVPGSRGLPSNR